MNKLKISLLIVGAIASILIVGCKKDEAADTSTTATTAGASTAGASTAGDKSEDKTTG